MNAFEWIERRFNRVELLASDREVFKVRDRLAPSPMGLAVLKKARSVDALEGLGRELTVLTDASHPALRTVRASALGDREIILVLDHLVGAPLSQCRLETHEEVMFCAIGMLRALLHLHSRGRVHGDIKPDNILLVEGTAGPNAVGLIDLELSRRLGSVVRGGTPRYLAPEHKAGAEATVAGDLFALGLTLSDVAVVREGHVAPLIEACLSTDPIQRPASADAALAMLGQGATPLDRLGKTPLVGPRGARDAAKEAIEAHDGTTVVVEAPHGSGRSRLVEELATPLLARGKPIADVRVEPGHDPLLALAGVVLDEVPDDMARAAVRGVVAAAEEGIPIIIDDADRLDEPVRRQLIVAARALRELEVGALVVVGANPAFADELVAVGARHERLGPLSKHDVEHLFEATSAPIDEAVIDALLTYSAAFPGLCARAVISLAARGGASPGEIQTLLNDLEESTEATVTPQLTPEEIVAEAEQALQDHAPSRAARLILSISDDEGGLETASILARAYAMSGRLDDAVNIIDEMEGELPKELVVEASCWLERLGRYERALHLSAPLVTDYDRAKIVSSRSTLSLGEPAKAQAMASEYLEETTAHGSRARLLCVMSDAALQEGHVVDAATLAEQALSAATAATDGSLRAQAFSRQAAALGLSGQHRQALEKHREAYEAARGAGDYAGLPPYILNVATAEESVGELGAALEHYEAAAELCRQLDLRSAQAAALFNQSGLLASLGALEEAGQVLDDAEQVASSSGMALYEAQVKLIRAELQGWSHPLRALELARSATNAFEACGAARQALEAMLLAAELAQRAGEDRAISTFVSDRAQELRDAGLWPRASLLLVRVMAKRDPAGALRQADDAISTALEAGDRQLQATALVEAASLHQALGTGADEALLIRAREIVGSIAARLSPGLRERYLSIRTKELSEAESAKSATRQHVERQGLDPDARRLLGLVGKLLLENDDAQLLEAAVDEAVQLTGAERAFLLRQGRRGGAQVVVARNVDGDAIKQPRSRFSHSVAAQVLDLGEMIVTSHATEDPDLAGATSIMDLGLRSILCVPIRVPAGVEAALYLDNRFEAGRFGAREVELIQALSNVIGVALENARLRREDREKADALERARSELEIEAGLQAAEVARLQQVLESSQLTDAEAPGGLVGTSSQLKTAVGLARRAGPTQVSILVEGESGTGKELLARFIHSYSGRRHASLHVINCGALSEQLLESELFGHVRGSFTGATRDHLGLFRTAEGGTVFLDEVAEMSGPMQTRLLRVLQEGEVRPVGGNRAEKVDVRVIAATNRHLVDEVGAKRFRDDLYYRLAGIEIVMPPLRDRLEDVSLLAEHFVERISTEPGMRHVSLSRAAIRLMVRYPWPGNVRELQQAIRRAVVTAHGDVIRPGDLGLKLGDEPSRDPRSRFDPTRVEQALAECGGNKTRTAERLGVSRMTLHRWIRRYGVG